MVWCELEAPAVLEAPASLVALGDCVGMAFVTTAAAPSSPGPRPGTNAPSRTRGSRECRRGSSLGGLAPDRRERAFVPAGSLSSGLASLSGPGGIGGEGLAVADKAKAAPRFPDPEASDERVEDHTTSSWGNATIKVGDKNR